MKKNFSAIAIIIAAAILISCFIATTTFAGVGGLCKEKYPELNLGNTFLIGDLTPLPDPPPCASKWVENDPFVEAVVETGWSASIGDTGKVRVYFEKKISKGKIKVCVRIRTGDIESRATVCGDTSNLDAYQKIVKTACGSAIKQLMEIKYAEIHEDLRHVYSINNHVCLSKKESKNGIILEIEGGYKLLASTTLNYTLYSPNGTYHSPSWWVVTNQIE